MDNPFVMAAMMPLGYLRPEFPRYGVAIDLIRPADMLTPGFLGLFFMTASG